MGCGSSTNAADVNAPIQSKEATQSVPAHLQPLQEIQADTTNSCVARVQAALDAIAANDGPINACVEVLTESALKQAKEADARLASGKPRRVLEGVPILVKINIDVKGTLSTASMPALKDWRPSSSAPMVAKLLEQGAIVVAKTNMPENAFGCWAYSPIHGLTNNCVNPQYSCGGSSSGTAAGIGARMALVGLGSDTVGSLRVPTVLNGIVGLRPTKDRYPQSGVIPCDPVMDVGGPMAATASDLAVLDAVMSDTPVYGPLESLSTVHVGVCDDLYSKASPGHCRARDLVLAALESAGARSSEVVITKPMTDYKFDPCILHLNEKGFDEYLALHPDFKLSTEEVFAQSANPLVKGSLHSKYPDPFYGPKKELNSFPEGERKAALEKFNSQIAELQEEYTAVFENDASMAGPLDVLISPVYHGPPPKVLTEEQYQDPKQYGPLFKPVLGESSGVKNFNIISAPSLALPTAALHENDTDGLPIPAAVLLWGKPGQDKALIQFAMALENALKTV